MLPWNSLYNTAWLYHGNPVPLPPSTRIDCSPEVTMCCVTLFMRCVDKCLLTTDQSTDSTKVQFEHMSFIRVTCRNMGRGYLREWLKDSCSTKVRCGIYSSSEKLVTSSPSNRQATKQIGKYLLGSSAGLNLFQELSLSESVSKQSLHAIYAWGARVFVCQVSFRDFLNETFELSTSWN